MTKKTELRKRRDDGINGGDKKDTRTVGKWGEPRNGGTENNDE